MKLLVFGGPDRKGETTLKMNKVEIDQVLQDFGYCFLELSRPLWDVQREASSMAPF